MTNFETDTAISFMEDVLVNGYGMIALAIDRITDEQDSRPGLIECEEALLAGEFIAAARSRPSPDFPEDAMDWVATIIPEGTPEQQEVIAIREKAADAIDRIVAESELRDFWDGTEHYNSWFDAQVDLQKRLLD